MIKRLFSIAFVVSINFAILSLCLALIEFGFRVANTNESGAGRSLQWLQFSPFMMFTAHPDPSNVYEWHDQFHKQSIHAKIFTNRLGFAMRQEVDFSRLRSKAENERVVLFTGGSAAWGVGATSNETNIAGRMQAILNDKQAKYHYTVLNLAMIGWVSLQQFIALAMFGPNLQPDWVVGMDGTNDAAVTCYSSQGAGYPLYYGLMEAYMRAYAFGQVHPVFYRGWIENQLIKYSVAYRKLTRQVPVDFDVLLDMRDPELGRSVIRATTWIDLERQLELYVQTAEQVINLFPRAKIILSTQPLPYSFQDMFGRIYETRGSAEQQNAAIHLKSRLDAVRTASTEKKCGFDLWDDALKWFMPASALRLEALANQYRNAGREVHYVNTGVLFPNLIVDRNSFFIDPVHLNERAMDVVAHFYSEMILATDLPDQFPTPQWTGKSLPSSGHAGTNIQ